MQGLGKYLDFTGKVGLFAVRCARRAVRRPFESLMIWQQIEDIGWKSLPLILSAGFAVGLVLTFHTRSTLLRFGAQAMIPAFQSLAFFNEMGPLGVHLVAKFFDFRISCGLYCGEQLPGFPKPPVCSIHFL